MKWRVMNSIALSRFQTLITTCLFRYYSPRIQVANNPEKAEAIANEADRLDELAQKVQAQSGVRAERTLLHASQDTQIIPSETTGIISISASLNSLGSITFASMAVCRILGYTRSQLEQQHVDILIPSPISEMQ